MTKTIFEIILINLKGFFREPAILFWAVLFPILMAWILGVAFSSKGETTRKVYSIGDESGPEKFQGTKVISQEGGNSFRITFIKSTEAEAIRAIKRRLISLYVEYDKDSVIYHFDPLNTDAQLLHLMLERELAGENKGVDSSVDPLVTQGTRYIDFLIPGLISLGIMNSCLWGIGWNLIETRMKKLLRRMVATPMKKSDFLAAQILTRVILGGVETILLLIFAWLYFGTEITGSITAFILLFLSGLFAFSGIGILVASRTDKSEVGNGLINAVTLSMTILSGIFFNYHNFPDWAVSIIQVLPLTMLADAIRSVFIEAAQINDVLFIIVALSSMGLVAFAAGLKAFRWY